MDEKVYNTIYGYLKPVVYQENSFIIWKGEPLDLMLFITQGVVRSFGSSSSPMERLERGDYYGIELLEWQLKACFYLFGVFSFLGNLRIKRFLVKLSIYFIYLFFFPAVATGPAAPGRGLLAYRWAQQAWLARPCMALSRHTHTHIDTYIYIYYFIYYYCLKKNKNLAWPFLLSYLILS